MISIALLGFGAVGSQVYAKLTKHPDYGSKFVISRIQTASLKDRGVYQNGPTLSNNPELFLRDSRYDTVIDCTEYNKDSRLMILEALTKGITLHTCSKELVWNDHALMIKLAKAYKSKIVFNSIPASPTPTEYSDINLTEENYADHEGEAMYEFRSADASITANQIVTDIIRQTSDG
jgi:homoserine dehydrogenase